MGVPKFFRYISERYPCLSELIREYQIPEFDNMYLDMNGIIHMCSHPDDNNPHFRITEEKIFQDIFHYLEVLFRMIRPQKLFFMAIDGVAPRAKMNQQRGRRFRSAKDAEKQEAEAKKKGETLPTEARFDSNCITPGTVFMARLHEQLKYFCTDKISNDPLWRNVKIILSGHETPGEGEHKIMDYIRYIRSQPGYDPNTRHCLYGLDADLVMLGLCTHEPHFSLLREEVKFGKKSTKRQSVPEEITFFLLHLSLMREYLELEFTPIKDKLVDFEYDFEKIIDDWVLMGFLVGNDFIPHLPHLHIANGALPILYKAYMDVLPTLDGSQIRYRSVLRGPPGTGRGTGCFKFDAHHGDLENGYINEGGTLNLARFEKFMQQLANFDAETFEEIRDDLTYMESKTGRKMNAHTKVSSTGRDLQEWSDDADDGIVFESIEPENDGSKYQDPALAALIQATDELDIDSGDDDEDDDEDTAFKNHKKEYYMDKMEYRKVTSDVLRDQAEGYVRAIQWNLHYYYNGVCSWSWYYPHHYAPYISDIKGFADLKLTFDLGKPFQPYEQLLGVLPAASKSLLPEVYHQLMTSEDSPIIHYYPEDFQTDKNGKRQEWEAVVLIPFMDEKLLLEAMRSCNEQLTPEEVRRNTHGPMLSYTYSDEDFGRYECSEFFPPIKYNHCKMTPLTIQDIRVPQEKLVKGAYPGATMDVYYPGFPTLKHLKYKAELKKNKVKVFEQPSRYESMIIEITEEEERDPEDIPVELLGTNVFINWPHLIEGRVVAISNKKTKYISMGGLNQYNTEEITDKTLFKCEAAGIIERYKNRLGIEVGDVKILCHVQVMIGRKYVCSPNGRLTLEKQFSDVTANYPLQTVVANIESFDSHQTLFRNVTDVFSEGVICFTLSNPYYGAQGMVVDSKETHKSGRVKVCVSITDEPNFERIKVMKDEVLRSYRTLFNVASQLGMSHYLYSRVTGSIFVETPDGEGGFKNVNVGLDLKFNKKNKETPGYTRKIGTTWYYTNKCTELVREYSEKFAQVFVYFADHGSNDNIKVEDIFGDDWEGKVKELQIWLRNIPTASLERQPCGSQVTELEIVEEIEKIVDQFPKIANAKKVTMTIKPTFLYKPELQTGTLAPDPKMQVKILDRIVNTRKGFSVPFGLKGTVIAIAESQTKNDRDTMYDVVFDKAFKDGMQLNCSPGRGYRLPRTAFINISFGKRVYEQKTGKEGSHGQKQENPWQNTNGQKFFTQFLNNGAAHRQIPDQFNYYAQKSAPQEPPQGSAFVPFTNKSRGLSSAAASSHQSPVDVDMTEKPVIQHYLQEKSEGKIARHQDEEVPRATVARDTSGSSFVKDAVKETRIERPPKEVLKERPAEPKNIRPTGEKPSVNTDFLKNLLKIGSDSNTDIKPTKGDNKVAISRIEPKPIETQSMETSANVSFEMLAQQLGNTPASVRLLTYYQSNGLGIPRYQYFQTDKKFKAQITLTNGDLVMSEAADTKEDATENVASDVLQLLMKTATTTDTFNAKPADILPVPPKTWVEPAKEKSGGREADKALKTALHNPFVPTQVIKRQSSKTNKASSQENIGGREATASSSSRAENHGTKSKTSKQNENNAVPSNDSIQQKRQKKSRIAANFGQNK